MVAPLYVIVMAIQQVSEKKLQTFCRRQTKYVTGVFVDNAMMLITLPEWTEKQMIEYYNTAIHEALSFGLTSIHDAATTPQMIQFLKMSVLC